MSESHSSPQPERTAGQSTARQSAKQSAKGWLQLLAVLALIVFAVLINRWMTANAESKPLKKAPEPRLPFIELAQAKPYTGDLLVQTNGTVEPTAYVNISPQVSGRVQRVLVDIKPGAQFKAGQALFVLEATDYRMEITRLKADLAAAKANLDAEQAEADAAKAEWELFGKGEINDLAARGPQLRSAQARIDQLHAAIARAKLNVQRTRYSLPFNGKVASGSVVKGQLLTANQPYGRVYEYASVEVVLNLTENDMRKIASDGKAVGSPVSISSSHNGAEVRYTGKIARLAAEVDRTTRMRTAYATFDASTQGLPPLGAFVQVRIAKPLASGAVALPASVLQDGSKKLWLVDAEKAELRASEGVEVVQINNKEVVLRGLQSGQLVMDGSLPEAATGMKVRWNEDALDKNTLDSVRGAQSAVDVQTKAGS